MFIMIGDVIDVLSNMQIAMCFSVERERLRERERQVRQQMSSQAVEREDAMPLVPVTGAPLFSLPVRVSIYLILVSLQTVD